MQHLTLGYLSLNATPTETITAATTGGFKSVGIRITGRRIFDPYTPVVGNRPMLAELKQRLADGGLRLSNVTAYHLFPDLQMDHMRAVIDTTAELGAGILLAHSYMPVDDKLIDFFARYCEYAAQSGIRIAVEYMRYSEVKSLEEATAWLDRAAQPNTGYVFDPLHIDRTGGSFPALRTVDPARIVFAQICDAKTQSGTPTVEELLVEARTGRLPPGEGDLPLYEFLDALPPDVEIEYEVPTLGDDAMSASDKALHAAQKMHDYLAVYAASRGRPDPWASTVAGSR
jgi:sugar phosphate isomerase/epimerase